MGCFDTILVPCPRCGQKYGAQSKSGSCDLNAFELMEAPQDVLEDVNRHAPFYCQCGATFKVDFHPVPYAKLISVDFDKKE